MSQDIQTVYNPFMFLGLPGLSTFFCPKDCGHHPTLQSKGAMLGPQHVADKTNGKKRPTSKTQSLTQKPRYQIPWILQSSVMTRLSSDPNPGASLNGVPRSYTETLWWWCHRKNKTSMCQRCSAFPQRSRLLQVFIDQTSKPHFNLDNSLPHTHWRSNLLLFFYLCFPRFSIFVFLTGYLGSQWHLFLQKERLSSFAKKEETALNLFLSISRLPLSNAAHEDQLTVSPQTPLYHGPPPHRHPSRITTHHSLSKQQQVRGLFLGRDRNTVVCNWMIA